jgi:hypothetical protein
MVANLRPRQLQRIYRPRPASGRFANTPALHLEPLDDRVLLSFSAPIVYTIPSSGFEAVKAADFNGDGKPDVALSDSGSNAVTVLLNTGNGALASPAKYALNGRPNGLTIGDFNADGRPDIAVANESFGVVNVLLGRGDGTFGAPMTFTAGSTSDSPFDIVVGDFNGDSRQDLAVTLFTGEVSILLGNGDGTFQSGHLFPTGSRINHTLVAGDFNHDGRLDLATANNQDDAVGILLGNGDGTFQAPVTYAAGFDPRAIVAHDFNGDGAVDIAVTNEHGNLQVLLNNGNGTFQAPVAYAVGASPHSLVLGDVNGDGRPDLVTGNFGTADATLLLGNSDGTFRDGGSVGLGTQPGAVALADLNGDGAPDLIAAGELSGLVPVLFNQSGLPPTATPNQRFVAQAYVDLPGRTADPVGLNGFSSLLDQGLATRQQVALAIESSPEYRTREIERLYQTVLRRDVDPLGLQTGLQFLSTGTAEQLQARLLGSQEYYLRFGGGTDLGFMSALYQDALGRAIDPLGARDIPLLLAHGFSRASVAIIVLGSPESDAREVQASYQEFLHRAADPMSLDVFSQALQAGLPNELLISVLVGSDEYFARV